MTKGVTITLLEKPKYRTSSGQLVDLIQDYGYNANSSYQEAKMGNSVQETKPGVKTTEFWVTMLTNVFAFLNMIGAWNYVPNKYSVLLIAVVNGLYALSRGQAKQGVAYNPNLPTK